MDSITTWMGPAQLVEATRPAGVLWGVQRGPGCHSDTARMRWTKDVDKVGFIGLDKKVWKMVEKVASWCKYWCSAKIYLVGNISYPKESFRTIRERRNLLALGHNCYGLLYSIALMVFAMRAWAICMLFLSDNHDDDEFFPPAFLIRKMVKLCVRGHAFILKEIDRQTDRQTGRQIDDT